MLDNALRTLKALSVNPRAASLGYDWMAVSIALVLWATAAAILAPPGMFPLSRSLILAAVLVLSAVLVAAREFFRSSRQRTL